MPKAMCLIAEQYYSRARYSELDGNDAQAKAYYRDVMMSIYGWFLADQERLAKGLGFPIIYKLLLALVQG